MEAKYSEEERHHCEQSLKVYRDWKGVIDTAFDDGQAKRTIEIARTGKLMGLLTEDLIKLTGLTKEEIDNL